MNNDSAIEFYKKFDFEVVETYSHYYKRIEPADAHVLQKTLKKNKANASIAASSLHNNSQTIVSNSLVAASNGSHCNGAADKPTSASHHGTAKASGK